MKRLLIQCQLSNYNADGIYILEADSGFQMMIGRVIEILKIDKEVIIDILVASNEQMLTLPGEICKDYNFGSRVNFIEIPLTNHAIKTRYDFPWDIIHDKLFKHGKEYSHIYINDPMLFRHYKALFNLEFKTNPKFIIHNHFIDNPEAPKVPQEVTYWYGQMEAAIRSDWNFFQCETTRKIFFESMGKFFNNHIVNQVRLKSSSWDDGYSYSEINIPINYNDIRFTLPKNKIIIFIPNRIGGLGRSFDYTNNGKFLFDYINKLYTQRKDFVVICGNPNQKISNDELKKLVKPYIKLVPGTFTRNEYRYICKMSHINVGLYDQDTYGGTAWRECINQGCLPLSLNVYEYKRFFDKIGYPFACKEDFSDILEKLNSLIDYAKFNLKPAIFSQELREMIFDECSFESTTKRILDMEVWK